MKEQVFVSINARRAAVRIVVVLVFAYTIEKRSIAVNVVDQEYATTAGAKVDASNVVDLAYVCMVARRPDVKLVGGKNYAFTDV